LSEVSDVFTDIVESFIAKGEEWKAVWDMEAPESAAFPEPYDKLDSLSRLSILRCMRLDRVYIAASSFVADSLGERYIQPPVLSYDAVFTQSTNKTPIMFVLSPGADPTLDIFDLGERRGFSGPKLKFLPLGQGQAEKAERFVRTGAARGQWVLLMNAHLLSKWLKKLEQILETEIHEVHPDFRLWLTTEPTDKFPLSILQNAVKVVTEPPDGLKLNMRQQTSRLTDDQLTSCESPTFMPLTYVLTFFHAIVQDRRKYGKIGWNVPYDFNDSDFSVSLSLLEQYLSKAHAFGEPTPWESLRYLVGEVMYGGRVSDDFDRRVVNTYLQEFFGDFLFDDFQPFSFYEDTEFRYYVPPMSSRDEFAAAVESLPLLSKPEVFGLHSNAEISYLENSTRSMMTNLIALQPRAVAAGGGISREAYLQNVAAELLTKVPAEIDLIKTKKKFSRPSPTDVVLLQEIERFNVLVELIRLSLIDLQRALAGEIGMSSQLDALATNLYAGLIPDSWKARAPDTLKPLAGWILHFIRRHAQYEDWIERERDPTVIWLSGLHVPESYLTALVQEVCHARGWPLDRSTLYTKVTDIVEASTVEEAPEHGCYVQGVFLEGAGWDLEKGVLRRQRPKELITPLPLLEVIPVEQAKLRLRNTFRAPVYVTSDRRNAMGVGLVFEADLSTKEHSSHWVLQGVACILNDA
ncbi:dynein heavy chain, partial [Kipferlia bialata]